MRPCCFLSCFPCPPRFAPCPPSPKKSFVAALGVGLGVGIGAAAWSAVWGAALGAACTPRCGWWF